MRVALLGPVAWRTPPQAYGPWEQVVSLLAEDLVSRGVDVTLFATLDSQTSADLDGVCPRPYNEDPQLDGRVWEALHTAHCLVHSRLSVIEAMACGTPVVGYRRGALPETVEEGVTGFLVDDIDGGVAAVPRALALDRACVAAEARRRFSADRMVEEYLAVYGRLLAAPTARRRL